MTSNDSIHLVQALLESGIIQKPKLGEEGNPVPRGPVVTISRTFGSGGVDLARHLGTILGVKVFDKELLERVVEVSKVDRYLMEQLDEHVRGAMSEWATALITGKNVLSEDYRRHLFSVVVGIARRGGIIVGRGANLLLRDNPKVLHLRVVGSAEVCARRVAQREGITLEKACERVIEVNRERETFIYSLYKSKADDSLNFDLVLNSDRLSIGQMSALAVEALVQKGIAVPDGVHA